jgi:hypothetical protein
MRRPKPVEKPRVQIGDYLAQSIWGTDWYVAQKTGDGWTDYKRAGFACATKEGTEKLAALMNAARDLGDRGHLITSSSMYRDTDPRLWALEIIASAVAKATNGPQPELFHEYLRRLAAEKAEAEPAQICAPDNKNAADDTERGLAEALASGN